MCGTPVKAEELQSRFKSPESYTPKHLAEKILTSKAALEGERKQVTVLFADLKGSICRRLPRRIGRRGRRCSSPKRATRPEPRQVVRTRRGPWFPPYSSAPRDLLP